MSFRCCYCKKDYDGEHNFEVPPGYPDDPAHDGKPLCDGCGGGPTPTLDEICARLDEETRAS